MKENKLYDQFKFSRIPALKLLFFIFLGLLVPLAFDLSQELILILGSASLVLFVAFYLSKLQLIAYSAGSIAIGIMLAYQVSSIQIDFSEKFYSPQETFISGEIKKIVGENSKGKSYLIDCELDLKYYKKIESIIILYIYGDQQYVPGDLIKGKVDLAPAKPKQIALDFPEKNYLNSFGANFRGFAFDDQIYLAGKGDYLKNLLFHAKKSFIRRIEEIYEPFNSPIIIAILTGEKFYLGKSTKEAFSLTGTAHLLAVSGFHIGFISFILWIFLKMIRNKYMKIIIFTLLISGFVIFTGSSPSAVRAGLMGILVIFCYSKQWNFEMMNIFALAVIISLIAAPYKIFSISFQLSVSAVFGIIGFYKLISHKLFRIHKVRTDLQKNVINSLSVSIAATIFVAPVSAYYFGTYPVYSILANFIAIPIMGFVMVFAIASLVASTISISFAQGFAFASEFLLEIIKFSNNYILSLEYSVIYGDFAFYISLLFLGSFIYLITSKNLNHLILRLSTAVLIILLMPEIRSHKNQQLNRQYYTMIPLSDYKNIYLAAEYKKFYTQRPDWQIEEYLMNSGTPTIIYTYEPAYIFSEKFYLNNNIEIKRIDKNYSMDTLTSLIKGI